MRTQNAGKLDRAAVMTKAVFKAAAEWDLKQKEIASILGLSESQVSRLKKGQGTLSFDGKDFELAALLVMAYRSLDAIVGGDREVAMRWIRSENKALGQVPLTMMKKINGLCDVISYLDYRRARI